MSLRQLQAQFSKYLLQGDESITEAILGKSLQQVQARLGVYQYAYIERIVDALKDDFPVAAEIMREDEFHKLGVQFVKTHPSRDFSLRHYGETFPAFLLNHAEKELYGEMARFEWALRSIADTSDADIITSSDLRQIEPSQWPQLQLGLHPSVSILWIDSAIPKLWQNPAGLFEHSYKNTRAYVLWRSGIKPYFNELTEVEVFIIQGFAKGNDFVTVCNGLSQGCPEQEVAQKVVNFLQVWLENGIFCSLDISN